MTKPYADDALLRAADAIRAFSKTDGMGLFQLKADELRHDAARILHARAADVAHVQYAEAAGSVRAIERVLGIFEQILTEAETLKHE